VERLDAFLQLAHVCPTLRSPYFATYLAMPFVFDVEIHVPDTFFFLFLETAREVENNYPTFKLNFYKVKIP